MSMSTTYRSSVFACLYLGVLLFVAAVWFFLPEMPTWGAMVLIAFGILGLPFIRARVEINDEGITQQLFRSRSTARWADIISWNRIENTDSGGPDTITIQTRAGSFSLNHNCVYGKRLDFVESELRRRIAQHRAAQ
jgi:hypothetical protein